MNTLKDHVIILIREARRERMTKTSANRIVRSLKAIGLQGPDLIDALSYLDVCTEFGEPYSPDIKRTW